MYCVENKKKLFKLPIVQHMRDTRFIHQLCKMHIVFTVWIWHQHQQLLIRNLPPHFLQEHLMASERKEIYIYIYTCTLSVTVCVSGYFNELIPSVVIFETTQSWREQNYQAEGLLELYYHFRHKIYEMRTRTILKFI